MEGEAAYQLGLTYQSAGDHDTAKQVQILKLVHRGEKRSGLEEQTEDVLPSTNHLLRRLLSLLLL